jgi:hypothetical protein
MEEKLKQQQIPSGMTEREATTTAKTTATAKILWRGNSLHPTHRKKCAMDGAPVHLWWSRVDGQQQGYAFEGD